MLLPFVILDPLEQDGREVVKGEILGMEVEF
jgi:hypothetical protein